MSATEPQTKFHYWPVEGLPVQIEFTLEALEEVAATAVDGLYRFRHGGMEVGGVLYGTTEQNIVRITAFRPLDCDHAFGPRFVLSERDRAAMTQLLELPAQDPALQGLTAVGWYHSHTRSEVALSPRDVEIYDRFFSQPTQVALVLRPENYGASRAGFFVREANGVLRTESSYHEFAIRPRRHGIVVTEPEQTAPQPAAQAPAAARPKASAMRLLFQPSRPRPTPAANADAGDEPAEGEGPNLPSFANAEPARGRKWWIWLAAALILVLLGGVGLEAYDRYTGPPPVLYLWVADIGGQLLIDWDRTAPPVRSAEKARLEILDGNNPVTVPISPERLREGSVDYVRTSDTVDVKLVLEQRGGGAVQESIRFVGQPVRQAPTAAEIAVQRERDALKMEVEALRAQLQKRDARRRTPRTEGVRAAPEGARPASEGPRSASVVSRSRAAGARTESARPRPVASRPMP